MYYKGDKNATTIVIPYDKKTKEFGYIFEKPLDKIDLTNNEQCYQEITHFPDQYNLTSCRRYFYTNTAEHIDLTNFNITKPTVSERHRMLLVRNRIKKLISQLNN